MIPTRQPAAAAAAAAVAADNGLPPAPVPGPWPGEEALVHVDPQLIVCDKPAGLLAVPGRGEGGDRCLIAWLRQRWPEAEIVHRLDMATSGLMVFARGKQAQRALSQQFAERQVSKRYEAVVAGALADTGDWDLIDLPLSCDWPNRPRQRVDHEHGRPATTRWRVLWLHADTTRVLLEPVTGRTHQLRVHLQALGHPILGDTLYAPPACQTRADRLLLHAVHLSLTHPAHGARLAFERPAPF